MAGAIHASALRIHGVFGAALLFLACAAQADLALDTWHREAAAVRELAENDAVAAYQRALALRANLPPVATDADQARALNLLARIEMYLAKTEDAATHARQALDVAERGSDRVGQAEAHLIIGVNSINLGKAEAMVEGTSRAMILLDGIDRPDLIGETLLRKSMAYRRAERFDDSVTMAMQTMEIARQNGNALALTYASQAMGISLAHSERHADSLKLYSEMREHAIAAHSKLLEADAIAGISNAKAGLGDTQEAEVQIRKAIELYRQVGTPFYINQAIFSLAHILRQEGHRDQAVQLLSELIESYGTHPSPIGLWYCLIARSGDYQALHNLPAAAADADRAYVLAKSIIGYPLYLSQSAWRLADIAASRNDMGRAYHLSVEAAATAEKAARERAFDRMVELAERYQAESRQRQIRELTQRNEQQAAELSRRMLERRWLWTVLMAAIAALAGVVVFVLRQRQLQRREAALSEARQLARQRSEFMARMSHELRTPLNAILGFANILKRDGPLSDRQARGLKIIDESGQHLVTLIDDILDLARVDANRLELFPADVDLPAFLRVVCEIVRVKADDKGLLFDYEPATDLPAIVRVDKKRLRQVLLNLLSNAVKFSDRGRVTLRAIPVAPGAGEDSSEPMVRLRFEVEDQGIGMGPAQLERLFQAFEQVSDVERRAEGTGLGLAISRQLVRLMGGDIQVSSHPGEGSLFVFEIDARVPSAEVQTPVEEGPPIGYLGERRTILVVDDVAQNRTMLVDLFGALGFDVAEAGDGGQALEVAVRTHPDLVVMDLTMPVMDGFEATRRLRRLRECATTPIIATSASVRAETESLCRAAGANLFMGKPIRQAELLDAVGALLGLVWARDKLTETWSRTDNDAGLVPPPPEEMVGLRGLARMGNMRSIIERADQVQALDPRYAPFAARLRTLAQGYQSKAISALIERYAPASEERNPS
jgi:signal transduction histidine kinase/DNA-binding NarL/FixJ family response regulator